MLGLAEQGDMQKTTAISAVMHLGPCTKSVRASGIISAVITKIGFIFSGRPEARPDKPQSLKSF